MLRIDKTVFLSYRRDDFGWAFAIFQDLTSHGWDVFFDFTGIASGAFETIIIENIKARAHFLVLLTPLALARCNDPEDWLRREIETALATKRNIINITLPGFDFGAPTIKTQLIGELATLSRYNALPVPPAYFQDAMRRLREQFLNIPLDAVRHPPSVSVQKATKEQQSAVKKELKKIQDSELPRHFGSEAAQTNTQPSLPPVPPALQRLIEKYSSASYDFRPLPSEPRAELYPPFDPDDIKWLRTQIVGSSAMHLVLYLDRLIPTATSWSNLIDELAKHIDVPYYRLGFLETVKRGPERPKTKNT
jgi:hypothetical protein